MPWAGIGVVTGWLRASVDGYVALCEQNKIWPATGIDAGRGGERRMDAIVWERRESERDRELSPCCAGAIHALDHVFLQDFRVDLAG